MPEIIFPKIGEIITPERGIQLCRYFGLDHIVARMSVCLWAFEPFEFDGCTGLPDELFDRIGLLWLDWENITVRCCLPHDLEYNYGIPGDEVGRYFADLNIRENLVLKASTPCWVANTFFAVVRKHGKKHYGGSVCGKIPN